MVRRRQLSAILRRYRLESGISVKSAAEQLYESSSKITRIEKGQRPPSLRDIRDLCVIYGISDEIREQLMDLARDSRGREWWQRPDLNPALQVLIGMEGAAKSISEFELALFPGLLQTRAYADAVVGSWIPDDAAKRNDAIEIRMKRQEILHHPDSPDLHAVIDESVVRRVVGGPDVMREQLRHVEDVVTTMPRVEVRVVPLASGMHVGVTNGFTVLEFENLTALPVEPPIPGVVYLEVSEGDRYLDAADDVAEHLARFERLRSQALPADESLELMRAAITGL